MTLLLASASPRRAELLSQLDVEFRQAAVDIDESPVPSEPPKEYVGRMSRQKAEAAFKRYGAEGLVILAADTTVVLGTAILGKPTDFSDFADMMRRLSNQRHQVLTSVSVVSAQKAEHRTVVSSVQFGPIHDEDIRWYWNTGEPGDKAGGYGIQGRGARFVRAIEGSYSGIVGLPLYETAEMLADFGVLSGPEAD